mgnify:CR=1 FL=1
MRTQRYPGPIVSQSPKLHKKWVIGSSHYGAHRNYARDFQFFSVDDIPPAKKRAHDEVCEFVDPDVLELKKRNWNASVTVPKYPHLEETFERKLTKVAKENAIRWSNNDVIRLRLDCLTIRYKKKGLIKFGKELRSGIDTQVIGWVLLAASSCDYSRLECEHFAKSVGEEKDAGS